MQIENITDKQKGRAILDLVYERQRQIINRLKKIRSLKSYKTQSDNNFNLNFKELIFEIRSLKYEHDILRSIARDIKFKSTEGIFSDDNMLINILTDAERGL